MILSLTRMEGSAWSEPESLLQESTGRPDIDQVILHRENGVRSTFWANKVESCVAILPKPCAGPAPVLHSDAHDSKKAKHTTGTLND